MLEKEESVVIKAADSFFIFKIAALSSFYLDKLLRIRSKKTGR